MKKNLPQQGGRPLNGPYGQADFPLQQDPRGQREFEPRREMRQPGEVYSDQRSRGAYPQRPEREPQPAFAPPGAERRQPPRRPVNRQLQQELRPYPGYTPNAEERYNQLADEQRKNKKRGVLPVVLSLCLVLVLLGAAFFFLRSRGVLFSAKANPQQELALRERTNRFRVAGRGLQSSASRLYNGVRQIGSAAVGSDQIKFFDERPANPFVDNDEDWNFVEQQDPSNMGRVVIPGIGSNGPMAADATEATLYYGFGFWPNMKNFDEEGQSVVLAHRCLTKNGSMFYVHEMKEGDPFWIDNYLDGKRYCYQVRVIKEIPEEELGNYLVVSDGEEVVKGNSVVLDTCGPLKYNASEVRILVYGEVVNTLDIPEDDPYFQRYKSENPQ